MLVVDSDVCDRLDIPNTSTIELWSSSIRLVDFVSIGFAPSVLFSSYPVRYGFL